MPVPRKSDMKKKAAPKRRPASSGPARKAAPAGRGGSKPSAAPGARSAEGAKRSAGKRPGAKARSPRASAPPAAVARDGKRELLRKLPILRKPAPRHPVDIGIGAVEILPPKDSPWTIGIAAAEAAMDKKA